MDQDRPYSILEGSEYTPGRRTGKFCGKAKFPPFSKASRECFSRKTLNTTCPYGIHLEHIALHKAVNISRGVHIVFCCARTRQRETGKPFYTKREKMPKKQSLNKHGRTSRVVTRSYARMTSPACPYGSVEAAELSPEPSQHESGTDPTVWTGAIRENVLNQPVQAGPAAPQATHLREHAPEDGAPWLPSMTTANRGKRGDGRVCWCGHWNNGKLCGRMRGGTRPFR